VFCLVRYLFRKDSGANIFTKWLENRNIGEKALIKHDGSKAHTVQIYLLQVVGKSEYRGESTY
jgi:hypothetical protein